MIGTYVAVGIICLIVLIHVLRGQKMKNNLKQLSKENCIIVDVRTVQEFQMGANPRSINIPLDKIMEMSGKLDKNKTIVVCCASGVRSSSATSILMRAGFNNVVNAGPWMNTLVMEQK